MPPETWRLSDSATEPRMLVLVIMIIYGLGFLLWKSIEEVPGTIREYREDEIKE